MSEATYRFENAKQGRAGCQNSACLKAGVKIQKGELRLGTLVTFREHTSWKWKHWGCVTPRQIANMQDQIGGVEGLDIDKDLDDILDGYPELTPESQDHIKFALLNGHVKDEIWKGDPELNRPGKKGINKRTPKKKANGEDASGSDAEQSSPSKPKKRSRKKAAAEDDDDDDDESAPKKKTARKRKADDGDEVDEAPAKKRGKAKKAVVKDEDVDTDEPIPERPKRKPRAKKVKAEPEPESGEAGIPQFDGPADSDDDVPAPAPKKRVRKSTAVKEEDVEDEEPVAKPAKKGRAKKVKAEAEVEDDAEEPEEIDQKPKASSRRSSRTSRTKA